MANHNKQQLSTMPLRLLHKKWPLLSSSHKQAHFHLFFLTAYEWILLGLVVKFPHPHKLVRVYLQVILFARHVNGEIVQRKTLILNEILGIPNYIYNPFYLYFYIQHIPNALYPTFLKNLRIRTLILYLYPCFLGESGTSYC